MIKILKTYKRWYDCSFYRASWSVSTVIAVFIYNYLQEIKYFWWRFQWISTLIWSIGVYRFWWMQSWGEISRVGKLRSRGISRLREMPKIQYWKYSVFSNFSGELDIIAIFFCVHIVHFIGTLFCVMTYPLVKPLKHF